MTKLKKSLWITPIVVNKTVKHKRLYKILKKDPLFVKIKKPHSALFVYYGKVVSSHTWNFKVRLRLQSRSFAGLLLPYISLPLWPNTMLNTYNYEYKLKQII